MEQKLCYMAEEQLGKTLDACTNQEVYGLLLQIVKEEAKKKESMQGKRKLYYISAEFLIGKLLSNNLINLKLYEEVKTVLEKYGKNLSEIGKIASCVKHIAGYGAVEAGRDYNTVDMSEREFRQYYLPAYKSAIEAGAEMIMTSFNILNGIPSTVNKWLIQEVIRKELGFKGIIISDYNAIEETIAVSPWKVPMRPSDTDTDAASLVCESMIFFAFSVFTEKTHINKNIIKG